MLKSCSPPDGIQVNAVGDRVGVVGVLDGSERVGRYQQFTGRHRADAFVQIVRDGVIGNGRPGGGVAQVNAVIVVHKRVGCDVDRAAGDVQSGNVVPESQVADDDAGVGRERLLDADGVTELARKGDCGRAHAQFPLDDQLIHAGVDDAGRLARFIIGSRCQPHGIVLRKGRPGARQARQSLVQGHESLGGLDDPDAVHVRRPAGQAGRFRGFRRVAVRPEVDAASVRARFPRERFQGVAPVDHRRRRNIGGHEALRCRVPAALGRQQVKVRRRRGLGGAVQRVDGYGVGVHSRYVLPFRQGIDWSTVPRPDAFVRIQRRFIDIVVIRRRSGMVVGTLKVYAIKTAAIISLQVNDHIVCNQCSGGIVCQIDAVTGMGFGMHDDIVELDADVRRCGKIDSVPLRIISVRVNPVVRDEGARFGLHHGDSVIVVQDRVVLNRGPLFQGVQVNARVGPNVTVFGRIQAANGVGGDQRGFSVPDRDAVIGVA